MTDAPAGVPPLDIATGIVTTEYSYPLKEGSTVAYDRRKPSTGSVAKMYHGCTGEWVSVNEVIYRDDKQWYKLKCAGCGAYGHSLISYPKVKTS